MNFPTPSVGRQVWFYENLAARNNDQPSAATVIKVHDPEWCATPFSMVNLAVLNPNTAETVFWEDVPHSPAPVDRPHYCWMPYQLAQHEKHFHGGYFGSTAGQKNSDPISPV